MASLHFCAECNNLLYPKGDNARQQLAYACRICSYEEVVENKCVYKDDLLTVTKEQVGVTTDLGSDPTLAHSNIPCPKCGHDDAVFYQDQSKRKETRMILFYVCVKCNHTFQDPALPPESRLEL
ncbi:DNA-directed RNA polymerase II [Coprinopsis cinerea okayama7|uniref:DNA-directed RNA polymerase subunit n=1 Tax=Coprinopsis cinerea (strain Okayama-7 / 130 / ATCC MYA-4618 / FGSC 9003) TaxID=240176 RepID=A8NUD2_COPC7|nr:DNA-directed RNA polymerase II [Coprinopsis cinerea okayama7\|eukprot:XP_001836429.2 DNA-directed RNA polymerase II [Coprinopsis cinerea okayama7\